jgi:ribitol-5-phosphate 2-dehydrogenase
MINRSYRLIAKKEIVETYVAESCEANEVVVRPTMLAICHADQRYYQGERSKEVMMSKLPMALIHEAVGKVVYDPQKNIPVGTSVVLIPNAPVEDDEVIKENYLRTSKFKSSGTDGFMQSLICIDRDRVISTVGIPDETSIMIELLSVVMNALQYFESHSHLRRENLGVWGDGTLGYLTALVLKKSYPKSKVFVVGGSSGKSEAFTFVDAVYHRDKLPSEFIVDQAFECVGGVKAERAVNQIIDVIKPQGTISLMGVSEENIAINTRMVLEKGISLVGNSRSSYEDFEKARDFILEYEDVPRYLGNIVSDIINITDTDKIHEAFSVDKSNKFKTILRWEM